VANAHEAARDHVQEKAAEEFVGGEREDLHAVVVGVILPAEPDVALAVIDEPIIRERDTVGVPTEVVEYRLRAGEGPLRIHDPVGGPQPTQEDGESAPIGQIGGASRDGQLAGIECAMQAGEILRAKDRRQGPNGKQKRRAPDSADAGAARDSAPTCAASR